MVAREGTVDSVLHEAVNLPTPHCNENPIYVFPEKELRGISPNFHIHLSVSEGFYPHQSKSTEALDSSYGAPT
jgi:hypothetical protein